jgi:signal transduction histidine kinase
MVADSEAASQRRHRLPFPSSLRARITLAALMVVGVALAACGLSLTTLVRNSLVSNIDEAAGVIAKDVEARLAAGDLPSVIPVQGGRDDDDLVIQVLDRRGAVVAATENYPGADPVVPLRPESRRPLRTTVQGLAVDPAETFRVQAERTFAAAGEPMTIYVATELHPVRQTVADVRRAVMVGAPSLLALTGLLVWVFVGRVLRSVEAIRRQVASISQSDLDRRVPEPPVEDEIARLARTMNAMLARLQRSAERQQRFVADASHELRSPLTSTRSAVEVALADPQPTALLAAATDVLAETERMERLVNDLLFLAQDDEGRLHTDSELVDFDDVVRTEATRVRNRKRVVVDTTGVEPGRTWGVAAYLERAVRNLLENAERHARSRVVVTLSDDGTELVLAISDDGPGVAPEHRERIFERFSRVDDDRSRRGGGTGLGLAITREIVAAHGGDVTVLDAPGGGARFLVVLPRAGSFEGRPARSGGRPI